MTSESARLFRDIVQSRSLSKAAKSNGISQSAVSQHIQQLKATLGIEVVDTTTRPITITPAGRLYYDHCRIALQQREEFAVALEKLKQDVEGTVRVAAIYSVGLGEMVELEREFARRRPEAKLEVDYLRPEKVYEAVLADEADLGIVSYPEAKREIEVIPWRDEEMALALSPQHPLAQRGPTVRAADLSGVDFVTFDHELPIRRHVDRFLRELGAEVHETLHFDNLQMIKEALVHNVGVSIVPARVVQEDVNNGRLALVRIEGASLSRPVGVVHRRKKRFHLVAQAFLDLLRETSPAL